MGVIHKMTNDSVELLEPDVLGVLMEALTAHVQSVFTDETMTVAAEVRKMRNRKWKVEGL